MISHSKLREVLALSIFLTSFFMLAAGSPTARAQDVVVTAAAPDQAPQGTINLNVQVKGNGFKKGAIAKWLVTGDETDTGGVTVNSTTYVSPTELRANITVAPNARTDTKFDIKVTLTSGRTGKGTGLFTVLYNPPDPAIAYVEGLSGDLMVMNSDGLYRQTLVSQSVRHNVAPNWSPDGSQLVVMQSPGLYQYWLSIMDKDGSNGLDVLAVGDFSYNRPAWSPYRLDDGNYKILYAMDEPGEGGSTQTDQYLVNPDGTDPVNLTYTLDRGESHATWSPTLPARFVTRKFLSGDPPRADLILHEVVYENGRFRSVELLNLTAEGPLSQAAADYPAWARTQDKIAVEALDDIWVIDFTNAYSPVTTRLTNTPGYSERYPAWSPDDTQIVFARRPLTRNSKEKPAIFVMNPDGTNVRTLVTPADARTLDWRRCCPTCVTVCAP